MNPTFIHLRTHSEYSLVDGLLRLKPLVKRAAELGMPAIAVTDHVNLFATVKFYKAAVAAGIKPIIGADIMLAHQGEEAEASRLTLLCQDKTGYQNLIELVSRSFVEGQHHGKPIVQSKWLAEHSAGLIALSGGRVGELGEALLRDDHAAVTTLVEFYQQHFPDRFYLELQRTDRPREGEYISKAVALAQQHDLPVVATNDVCFLNRDDFTAHEARVAICSGYVLNDPRRPKPYNESQYLRSPEEMAELFADIPEALENTVEIAKRCNLELSFGQSYLPNYPVPEGKTIDDVIADHSRDGLQKRLEIILKDCPEAELAERRKPYDERLQIELDVICSMGFPGYFLIVADFIRWAKENAIPVGPGRGSGAGSLVAYALLITDLDPLQYDLLFERFLNPERVSMPDFDIDFCMDGRDRVIEYVAQTYGREAVSQIITYGTMAAKAVVRDVGRVLGQPYGFVDKLAKLIPFEIGITLDKAMEQEEELRRRYRTEEEVTSLIDLARSLEGLTRNVGKHAGGVVIAPSKLTDFTPLYCEEGGDSLVSQFDKDDVETVGLVKFDFLGLRTLTIIDWAVQAVNRVLSESGEPALDISLIPLDDEATFDLLRANQTTAVFQLESRGMKDLIKRLRPDRFEEIIALVALFRPGPLQSGMVDDFIDRKHGRARVEYPHPDLEPILSPTYGVILYQEQVMQIAQVLAGYSLGAADMLRRAMGKKKPAEMAKQRLIFMEGATKRGVEAKTATYIFDLMEKFAGYGFNKSHSAAYALLSYQTAWLKTHYPAPFMAAVLSSDMDNTDKVVIFFNECQQMKLDVVFPNVNHSQYKFIADAKRRIIYGLGAVKGVGESAIEMIIAARDSGGPFADLFEFCRRMDSRKVNRRVIEALIKSGAMDELGQHRAALMASVNDALKAAAQSMENKSRGQLDLFGLVETVAEERPQNCRVPEWDEAQRLTAEKESLGLYLSGHPIDRYLDELINFTSARIGKLKPTGNQSVVIAGLVVAIRTMMTKRGDRMAFITLDDGSGTIEMAVFSDTYADYRPLIEKDKLIVVEGEVSIDDYSGGYRLSARSVYTFAKAREVYAKRLLIRLGADQVNQGVMLDLQGVLQRHGQGRLPVCFQYCGPDASTELSLGKTWLVTPDDNLFSELHKLLNADCVEIDYR